MHDGALDALVHASTPSWHVLEDIWSIGINDLLVIDRSLQPENNKIAVCFIDGDFTVKRLKVDANGIWLQPENPDYPIIKITEENDFMIWGIVTNVIKKL